MGNKTNIEWTDATWNPIRGCSRVSEGCRNCYAETVANRFKGQGQPYEGLIASGGQWNGQIKLVYEKLIEPLRWQRPRRIFVNSMSDLFHENVPFEYIASVFAVMSVTTRHTYQVLTKRPARMLEFFDWALHAQDFDGEWKKLQPDRYEADRFQCGDRIFEHWPLWIEWDKCGYDNCGPAWPYQNIWLGVSVEDQSTADERIPLLLQTPAAVRWISAEPLLGPINLNHLDADAAGNRDLCQINALTGDHSDMGRPCPDVAHLNWVVVGGESGPGARPMHPDWARSLRDQCAAAGVEFLFKQWGEWAPWHTCDVQEGMKLCDAGRDKRINITHDGKTTSGLPNMPGDHTMYRLGKKAAGRLLDCVLHDGYPE